MQNFTGIPASPGLVCATAFVLDHMPAGVIECRELSDFAAEIEKFKMALGTVQVDLSNMQSSMKGHLNADELSIYDAHQEILNDPELIDRTIDQIKELKCNAEFALHQVASGFIQQLEQLEDEYFSARAKDVREVSGQLIATILGKNDKEILLSSPIIFVANEITTRQLSTLDTTMLLGIVTGTGGATDHTAIISKALGIPAVVGLGEVLSSIKNNDQLLLNGEEGTVIHQPDESAIKTFEDHLKKQAVEKKAALNKSAEKAITKTGKEIKVYANIATISDAMAAAKYGADGIGLLRTELSFLDNDSFPSEEEQYDYYKNILEALEGKETVIRLIDFGSDKKVPYINMPDEENPALGLRALRLGFEHYEALLKPQIRALLRISASYNIKILCPMIATPEDFIQIRDAIHHEGKALTKEGFAWNQNVRIGIMVEVPFVAFFPEQFVELVDFFSFGTNDLAQFLMAADRTNSSVSNYLPQATPAIVQLIDKTVQLAHLHNKWVGICGELASDKNLIKSFIDIHLDEISMPPALIPEVKQFIRNLL